MKFLPAFSASLTATLPIFHTTNQPHKGSAVRILSSFLPHPRTASTLRNPGRRYCRSRIFSAEPRSDIIMADQVVHEPEENRYAMHMEGVSEPAFLRYHIEDSPTGKVYNLTHTYVTPAMRGRGVAAKLVQKAVAHAREDDHKVIPTCSYIVAYMKKHEQDRDVVYDQ